MDEVHDPFKVRVGVDVTASFECGYCESTGTVRTAVPGGGYLSIPLPDGWTTHQGWPVCPRHQVLVVTPGGGNA